VKKLSFIFHFRIFFKKYRLFDLFHKNESHPLVSTGDEPKDWIFKSFLEIESVNM